LCSRFSNSYLITYAGKKTTPKHLRVELIISTELQTTITAVLLGDGNYITRLSSKMIVLNWL